MRKFFNALMKVLLAFVILCAIVIGIRYYFGENADNAEEDAVAEESDTFDLELPGEVEKRVVTVDEVESKLVEIGELSTYSGEYTYTRGKDEPRKWLHKIPILGATNSIEITCKGVVKVGYNLSDINVRVDDDKIYISIPEARINDNYVIWDSVECKESNNIFNPIEFGQYEEIIAEIEKKGLEDVTAKGIYQSAEENLKDLIGTFLADFDGYEIVYE